jgi:hypothetical protein
MNRITQVGDVVKIHLQNGEYALIDAEDWERCKVYHWHKGDRYVLTHVRVDGNKRTSQTLHRYVMGLPQKGKPLVDHRNRNRLDCRKQNLRLCNSISSARNRGKVKANRLRNEPTSKFKGVHRSGKKWRSIIYVGSNKIDLGTHVNEEMAAIAYDKAAREYFGEFAVLNFPDVESQVS